jgi:hypothetical protein
MTGPWPIPVEVIKRLASPTGVSSIIKASLRGAVLKPMGRIWIHGGHVIGEIDFTFPIDVEQQDGLVVMLGVPVEESAAGVAE